MPAEKKGLEKKTRERPSSFSAVRASIRIRACIYIYLDGRVDERADEKKTMPPPYTAMFSPFHPLIFPLLESMSCAIEETVKNSSLQSIIIGHESRQET